LPRHRAAPKRPRGRPVGDHDRKRTELIDAAWNLIIRDGYEGATMRRIAIEAHCSTGTVSHYFTNKNAIVTLILERIFAEPDESLAQSTGVDDVVTSLKRILHDSLSMPQGTWSVAFQLASRAGSDPALATLISDSYAKFRVKLYALIKRGQAQGKIRTDFPSDLLGDQLCALADGWMMMTPIDPSRYDNEARRSALAELAIAMMQPPGSRARKPSYPK
jgi:AcrR family transcriptional regulator